MCHVYLLIHMRSIGTRIIGSRYRGFMYVVNSIFLVNVMWLDGGGGDVWTPTICSRRYGYASVIKIYIRGRTCGEYVVFEMFEIFGLS